MSTLYNRLVDLCDQKGIRGGRMCSDLGFSKSLMTDLKSGRKKGINAETAHKIAEYFGVTVGYLLGEEETRKSPAEPMLNEGEKMLLDLFRQIPEDRQQVVIAMIKAALDRG